MIELFGDATGNSTRAAIALEEFSLTYEPRKVTLARGEHRAAEYLRLNPTGRVPTLVDADGPGGERLVTPRIVIADTAGAVAWARYHRPSPPRDAARAHPSRQGLGGPRDHRPTRSRLQRFRASRSAGGARPLESAAKDHYDKTSCRVYGGRALRVAGQDSGA
jgi:Glutathione S-transferase, N-terminal domain